MMRAFHPPPPSLFLTCVEIVGLLTLFVLTNVQVTFSPSLREMETVRVPTVGVCVPPFPLEKRYDRDRDATSRFEP